jgi:hypothetical protein
MNRRAFLAALTLAPLVRLPAAWPATLPTALGPALSLGNGLYATAIGPQPFDVLVTAIYRYRIPAQG